MGMSVRVNEVGNRPLVMTTARRYAPQAARVLGELFGTLSGQGKYGHERFGDAAFVVLDWSNETGQLPDGSRIMPILYLQVQKHFPDGAVLKVDSRIDVDDVFTSDVDINNDVLAELVVESLEKVARESEAKGRK